MAKAVVERIQSRFFGFKKFTFVVQVRTVDLVPLGVVLPRDRVGMVICQPYVQLNNEEPFCWRNAGAKAAQLEVISKTLEIARSNPHGLDRTHFTIFPEYSICGLDGVTLITEALTADNWSRRTIVIGGVDGLSKQDFTILT